MNKPKQLCLHGDDIQRERALKHSKLEKLNRLIDWEIFRPVLKKKLIEPKDYSQGGRPRFDVVLMFKIIILQQLFGNLSNEATEDALVCRIDWILFLGCDFGDKLPDENTIRTFKEEVGLETMEELFSLFNKMLYDKGIIATKGTMVDASFNDVPRRRATTKEENELLKKGEVPDSLKKIENPANADEIRHNNRVAQIDVDATWAKKGNETHFGYKAHAAVDEKSKIVTNVAVTTASTHDVNLFVFLISVFILGFNLDVNETLLVFADSGYQGKKYAETLKEMFPNLMLLIVKKKIKNGAELTDLEKAYNRAVSSRRVRVEHVFGSITNDMGGMKTSTIGQARNARDVVTKFLAYNIKRAVFLFSKKNIAVC